jgi:hypothetical protein
MHRWPTTESPVHRNQTNRHERTPDGSANRGEVTEHLWKDGTTVSYGVRVRAYGKRYRLPLGDSRQGWNRTHAEIELERIEQQIQRGHVGTAGTQGNSQTPAKG